MNLIASTKMIIHMIAEINSFIANAAKIIRLFWCVAMCSCEEEKRKINEVRITIEHSQLRYKNLNKWQQRKVHVELFLFLRFVLFFYLQLTRENFLFYFFFVVCVLYRRNWQKTIQFFLYFTLEVFLNEAYSIFCNRNK